MSDERKLNVDLPVLKKDWEGNRFCRGRFVTDSGIAGASPLKLLKWVFGTNPQRAEKRSDTFALSSVAVEKYTAADRIVWLGHASFAITVGGVNIITDPCFFDLPGRRRKVALPCEIGDLGPVDYILLSHDHRDHLDKKSMARLLTLNPSAEVLMPLNMERLIGARVVNVRKQKTQPAGWYQQYATAGDTRIIFLPARHWGRRLMNDTNKHLWGSFLIISGGLKIYFAADTAYGPHFKEIREMFGDIDICLMPVGAYSPDYIMKDVHMNPEEAAEAFADLGGRTLIPMHYGTYDLSDEPPGEPIARIKKCFEAGGVSGKLEILDVGGGYRLG